MYTWTYLWRNINTTAKHGFGKFVMVPMCQQNMSSILLPSSRKYQTISSFHQETLINETPCCFWTSEQYPNLKSACNWISVAYRLINIIFIFQFWAICFHVRFERTVCSWWFHPSFETEHDLSIQSRNIF